MNQPISGLFDFLKVLEAACHPAADFVLYGEDLVFEFKGLLSDSRVHFYSLEDAAPTSLTDETIRAKIQRTIQSYLSVVIIIYSSLNEIEQTTKKQFTEISGYSIQYQSDAVSYLKLAGTEVQKVAFIDPLTGEPKLPEPNEKFL